MLIYLHLAQINLRFLPILDRRFWNGEYYLTVI